MAYEKQTWVDNETPIDAAHLNHMEDGIAKAHEKGLPEVAASDAGKFLRVSSAGTWGAETISSAEGVSF